MHIGRSNPCFNYTMDGKDLIEVSEEKDVGVIMHASLKPSLQCSKAASKANQVLGQLCRAFKYRDKITFVRLFVQGEGRHD